MTCDACGSHDVKHVINGFPSPLLVGHPDVALGGCVRDLGEEPPDFTCHGCDRSWNQRTWLDLGEGFDNGGRNASVTVTDLEWVPRIREHLIAVARRSEVVTYVELKNAVGLPHAQQGMGRLLDLVTLECTRRDEPTLASIAVNAKTGEVGAPGWDDAADEREALFDWWSQ